MKNDHHWLLHAFLVIPWVFWNPQGNKSEFGLVLDDIIVFIPKKNIKFSRLVFPFPFDYIVLKYSNRHIHKKKIVAILVVMDNNVHCLILFCFVRFGIHDKAFAIEWDLLGLYTTNKLNSKKRINHQVVRHETWGL